MIENFRGTESERKILEGLKRKVGIFIRTKNIIFWGKYFTIFYTFLHNFIKKYKI